MKRTFSLIALSFVAAAGCADTQPEVSACDAATEHLQSCMPDEQIVAPDTCNDDSAATILDSDCDSLRSAASSADGKADGCNPWFWWTCLGSSSGSNTDSDTNPTEPREPGMVCGTNVRSGDFESWRKGVVEDIAYGDGYVFAALTDWKGTLDDDDDVAIICAYEMNARASLYEEHCFIAEQPATPWDRQERIGAMAWEDGRLYVAVERGLYIYDVSDVENPVWIGEYLNGDADQSSVGLVGRGMEVHDGIVYLAGGGHILDARDPGAIRHLSEFQGFYEDWTVEDGILYAAMGYKGIATFDVNDPANPRLLDSYLWSRPGTNPNIGQAKFRDVAFENGFIFAAVSVDGVRDDESGLWVFDATDPSELRIVHQSMGAPREGVELVVADGWMFLARRVVDGYSSSHHQIGVYDVSDPTSPVLVDNIDDPEGVIKDMVVADGQIVYSTDKFGSSTYFARDGVGTIRSACE